MNDSHLKEQYANPFAAEQARRKLQKLTEQHYHGNGMQPPVNWEERAKDRATMIAAVSKHFPEWLDDERHRTAETLDAMLLAIDGLREAVKQMNAALVELKRHAEPKVVAMPARALRHGSPQ